MSYRVTYTNFIKYVISLEQGMQDSCGGDHVTLTTNVWHNHYSVYTKGENGSDQYKLVQASTARDAVAQIQAITDTLYAISKLKKPRGRGQKGSKA